VDVRELLDGRLVVLYEQTVLASQPSPGSHFVLTPRVNAGRERELTERRRQQRTTRLTRALDELAAIARASGRSGPAPAVGPSSPPPARSLPPTEHPWRRSFSRRGFELLGR
jgi:hypothetical protein